jgi:ribosomal protein L40E
MMTILTFVAVMVVTAFLFGGWLIYSVWRLIWRTVAGHGAVSQRNSDSRGCVNPGCRSANPNHARFCRRCGAGLTETIAMQQLPREQARFRADTRERRMAEA